MRKSIRLLAESLSGRTILRNLILVGTLAVTFCVFLAVGGWAAVASYVCTPNSCSSTNYDLSPASVYALGDCDAGDHERNVELYFEISAQCPGVPVVNQVDMIIEVNGPGVDGLASSKARGVRVRYAKGHDYCNGDSFIESGPDQPCPPPDDGGGGGDDGGGGTGSGTVGWGGGGMMYCYQYCTQTAFRTCDVENPYNPEQCDQWGAWEYNEPTCGYVECFGG